MSVLYAMLFGASLSTAMLFAARGWRAWFASMFMIVGVLVAVRYLGPR